MLRACRFDAVEAHGVCAKEIRVAAGFVIG
jgi:hypothetical protein